MANPRRYSDARGRPALAAVAGRRSGAAGRAQRRMPGAAGHARRRGGIAAALPPLLADAARSVGRTAGPRGAAAGGGALQPVRRRLRLGAALARTARTRRPRPAATRRSRRISSLLRRARSRAACWFTAGIWRAAGRVRRAWCSARPSPAVESLAACSLAALEAAAERNAEALRPRWAHQIGFWRELLAAASAGADTRLHELLLGGIQRLAAETLAAHAP